MNTSIKIEVTGLDSFPKDEASVCRSRLITAVEKLYEKTKFDNIRLIISTSASIQSSDKPTTDFKKPDIDLLPEERAKRYKASQPLFSFEQLVVPKQVEDDLLLAVDLIDFEEKIFDKWGLRKIEPFPRTALNFHGKPGTGKTLAAHAIASKINRPILVASYAQIESMYHGEGPKNVEAIFLAAERDNALLFMDEADSLLSKRLTNVTQGSEQAINSMRSQLLICLERFKGIVIFSTNLIKNYDKAFETRVRNVHFPMPDETCRREIWKNHLPIELPLEGNDDKITRIERFAEEIAKIDDICGRDIKNAVLDTAMRVARQGRESVELEDLVQSVERIKSARVEADSGKELTPQEKQDIKEKIKGHIANKQESSATFAPNSNF